ncbi:fructosamine-3-kinase [Kineococcus xinjiangensis]|uniref:Fructosamine-3-kinase n=1 Tax=Kineococcus xinjiangensis TaxID=512762 RepID=A0A2S6IVB6_9ACTN|nr:fructosamine-3-kinase [Kineococcus xinjiangensis]
MHVKRRDGLPPEHFAVEAAGLRWLAAAADGVAVAEPVEVLPDGLVLPRVVQVAPTPAAAEEFGRRLAATHAAGAPGFGSAPPGVAGDGWIAELRLPLSERGSSAWGPFYAQQRLLPFLRAARDSGAVDAVGAAAVERVCALLVDSDPALTGPERPPARLHGDLWSGNVLWSAEGAVLIDPAAHGGHPETDLAMLALFGLPHLDRALGACAEAAGLDRGWRGRVPLHQLHPLLVHAVLFGSGYGAQAVRAARACLALG